MSPPPMIGRSPALKATVMNAAITARLIAPMTTGLRSRNGVLIRCDTCPCWSCTPGSAPGPSPGTTTLALELTEVEVEPRAVDRRASDLRAA